jgi:uncharacterized protein YcbX
MIIGTIKEVWRYPVKSMAGERLSECTVRYRGIPGDRGWALRNEKSREITNGKNIPLLMQCAARYREEPTEESIPPVDITLPDGAIISSDGLDPNAKLSEVLQKELTLWPVQPASNKAHYRRAQTAARLVGIMGRFGAFRAVLPALTSFGSMNKDLRKVFSREDHEPIPDISTLPPEVLEFTSPPGTYFDAFPINLLTTASLEAMAALNPGANWDVRRFRPNFLIKTEPDVTGLVEAGWAGKRLRIGNVELKCEIPCMRCGMTMHAQKGLPKDPSVLRSIVKDADQNLGIYASVINTGSVKEGDTVELL